MGEKEMRVGTIAKIVGAGLTGIGIHAVVLAQSAPVDVPKAEFAFEEIVTLSAPIPVGKTGQGERNIVPISGGTFEGPGIRGTILPGGWDWQLRRADGCLEIKADYMLKTDDGVVINVVNQGVSCPPVDGKRIPMRTMIVFEAPIGKYDWLSKSAFVGTIEPLRERGGIRIRFYKMV
jgi:hypothetical protein